MKYHALYIPIIALALAGAGCVPASSPTTSNVSPSQPSAAAPTTPASSVTAPTPTPAPNPVVVAPNTVVYTDAGFSPAVLTVKRGTTVTFSNTASDDMRIASNPHPIHDAYPTKGGCVNSTLDSCSNIAPGTSWTFKFDIVGTWGFHNHLNPTEGGTIVVE